MPFKTPKINADATGTSIESSSLCRTDRSNSDAPRALNRIKIQLLRATGNLKLVADTLGITIKQASKYAKTQHEDVIEGKNKAFKQKVKEPLKNILYL